MSAILGVDVGKDTLVVLLLRADGAADQGEFANSASGLKQLWRFLKKRRATAVHVCMEATGLYYEAAADYLHEQGATVSVVNPARIQAYAASQLARNKTDRLDAALLADFCRSQQPPAWAPPAPAWRELRALARHLDDVQTDAQRQRNRVHAAEHASRPSATVLANLRAQLALLEGQIAQVKRAIHDHIDRHPDLQRDRDLLTSIPGIGNLTASKLLAELYDLRLFETVNQLVAYAGLNPRHHQSGSSVRHATSISKMGRASIRAALYMPALVAKQHNPILRTFAERLAQRGMAKLAVVVAVMRKLLHLAFGLLKSGQPFDPHYLDELVATS